MKVEVKYYGYIAEQLNKSESSVEIDEIGRNDLKAFFEGIHPFLKKTTFCVAVDKKVCNQIGPELEVGQIALLPPFAGG